MTNTIKMNNTLIMRQLMALPENTEIQQPDGIWRQLTEAEFISANNTDTIYGDGMPFWVRGWADLHHRLRLPKQVLEEPR